VWAEYICGTHECTYFDLRTLFALCIGSVCVGELRACVGAFWFMCVWCVWAEATWTMYGVCGQKLRGRHVDDTWTTRARHRYATD